MGQQIVKKKFVKQGVNTRIMNLNSIWSFIYCLLFYTGFFQLSKQLSRINYTSIKLQMCLNIKTFEMILVQL